MELKGSQTEKNLWAAFAGESQAHAKYLFYASQAKKGCRLRGERGVDEHVPRVCPCGT